MPKIKYEDIRALLSARARAFADDFAVQLPSMEKDDAIRMFEWLASHNRRENVAHDCIVGFYVYPKSVDVAWVGGMVTNVRFSRMG